MESQTANTYRQSTLHPLEFNREPDQTLTDLLWSELRSEINSASKRDRSIVNRMAVEVERICSKSSRIQKSGQVHSWEVSLGRHRLQKCLAYFRLGSTRGRVELHSNLSVMIYRHIAPAQSLLSFSARCNLIEDFLQDFYAESLKAFRRENELGAYQPRSALELAEYMAFTEQYAKRSITLPNGYSQQLVVLRSQSFAKRLPKETAVDLEQAVEFAKGEEAEAQSRSPMMQQLRSRLVSATPDPADGVLRDRVVSELEQYLAAQEQYDCIDYLALKLEDLSAPEIDAILGLTPRQRDYLQQRFKYHVEKFARTSHWELVHQWLGADIDQKLGLSSEQWDAFFPQLSEQQQQLIQLKASHKTDEEIAKTLSWTPKQVQKRWSQLLDQAAKVRNDRE